MSTSTHRPILVAIQGRGMNRLDCTCGAMGLATMKPTDGMAPVISAMKAHREAEALADMAKALERQERSR
jgi:hypothetical protein